MGLASGGQRPAVESQFNCNTVLAPRVRTPARCGPASGPPVTICAMSPADAERFQELIADLVRAADCDPPFLLILTSANETISIERYTASGIEDFRGTDFTSPVIISIIDGDGDGRSAKIILVREA